MSESGQLPVIYLMGPTASGKTAAAVELVRRFPLDIVSVDSAMVYRGLDIGTAKPVAAVLEIAPHRLIDICDPVEVYSAARFCDDAQAEIDSIHAAGRIPLLTGGTGLYFRSLEQGLSELPAADKGVRKKIEEDAVKHGWEYLHKRLAQCDPAAATRIHPNDPQRIQRALEVYTLTGKSLSDHFQVDRSDSRQQNLIKVVLCPEQRATLHDRIEQRFETMLDNGLVLEVEQLYQRSDLHADLPAMKLVGYRQIWKYLDGYLDYQQMKAHAVFATRQLAKRQLTWLRREQNCQWFTSDSAGYIDNLLKYMENIS